MRKISSRDDKNPYDTLCPACLQPAISRCRCKIGDMKCANGHSFFRCPIHEEMVVHGLGHGDGLDMNECRCSKGK